MTQSVVSTVYQRVLLTSIKDVEVTDIVDDGAGGFIRSLRFFGQGAVDAQTPLVFEVLIQSENRTDLKITTPEIDF
ncbi:MAG: hypothetical protein B7Y80_09330 [Hyphomicrobium sp. 32-62-53]|nr:MAG: hypothetical protein B7Z29_20150 [Hyphomicrobium sp. 12-62-95]OYX99783.1 MAG: hypothetical protein B7Y80_09330 [Hyphomicrobium sp. 32-62-53]